MTKVSYLLGTGASANALPITKNIPIRIDGILYEIINTKFPGNLVDKAFREVFYMLGDDSD